MDMGAFTAGNVMGGYAYRHRWTIRRDSNGTIV